MSRQFKLGDLEVDLVLKDIKNIHLSVLPPAGRVRISAPSGMQIATIRSFAISKLSWIKRQQTKLRSQQRETPREYLDRESHYVWGDRYLLKVIECDEAPSIELRHRHLILRVRPGTNCSKRRSIVEAWYREQLKEAVQPLIAQWEPRLRVRVGRYFVQQMKTKWGSCNASTRSIRLNTDLAKKPRDCLEYIVVHEMAHLVVRHHNDQFTGLMDNLIPNWKLLRQMLNDTPLTHAYWP